MRQVLLLIIFSILLSQINNAQVETVIDDGVVGVTLSEGNDTTWIFNVTKGGPAEKAGIKKGDIILEIDGSQVSGANLSRKEVSNLLSGAGGQYNALTILRSGTDSLLSFSIKRDFRPKVGLQIYFEYLVDSSGKWTIHDILTDSINALFSLPVNKKIRIHSIPRGSVADIAGLKPGDRVINFKNRLDGAVNLIESGDYINSRISDDSTIIVARDSSVIEIYLDLKKDPLSGVKSQYWNDLNQQYTWLRFITINKITEDRLYLFRAEPDDSVTLYEIEVDGAITEKRSGRLLDHQDKDFNFKDFNSIKVRLKKNERQIFYVRLVKTNPKAQFIHWVGCLSADYVSELDRLERLFLGILWGMILLIAVYYLILYFFVKEISYIYYSLFSSSVCFLLFYHSGYNAEFIPQLPAYNIYLIPIILAVFPITFYLLFGTTFLNLRENLKFWYRVFRISLCVILICTITLFVFKLIHPGYDYPTFLSLFARSILILLIIAPFIYVVPSILRIKHGYKPAWFFLVANITFLTILLYWYFLSSNIDFTYRSNLMLVLDRGGMEISIVIQILIFALGLGQKIRFAEKEKKLAQEKTIEQLKENEKLQDKVNRELEDKVKERTKEISQQKEEIESQRDELEKQRDLVTEQKQEITDSINYAKKIQTAVLPSEQLLDQMLPEHFILFKPKDIVSGDFYWIRQVKNFTVVVAADCTGHGVPGAFMSMLGTSMLNEIVSRSRFDSAGEILNRLRKKIKDTLSQEGKDAEQKDGMDMSLAILDNDNNEMQYAGAFNPLYLIRSKGQSPDTKLSELISMESDQFQLLEIRGDRQPIAIYSTEKDFTTNHIKIRSSDSLYMFSDGYPDQMGGPKGKKFMTKKFKELLLRIQAEPMITQKEILEKTLEDWKQNVQQIDDILVFGIKWK